MYSHARTLVASSRFEREAEATFDGFRRADQAMEAIDWGIATDPESWSLIPGTQLRVIETRTFPDALAVRVFFTIDDDNTCTKHAIDLIPEEELID